MHFWGRHFPKGKQRRKGGTIMKQAVYQCPVEATLSLIGGKYKLLILWHLIERPLHYMEIQRRIPNATPKMLSQQLHALEACGMIQRKVIPEKPPKTEYSLTTVGSSFLPVLQAMCEWGKDYLDGLEIQTSCGTVPKECGRKSGFCAKVAASS